MRNCLNCIHFSHKVNVLGLVTAERVCAKHHEEDMNKFFADTRPYLSIPPLVCCDIDMTKLAYMPCPTEKKEDPLIADISKKITLKKNSCYAR